MVTMSGMSMLRLVDANLNRASEAMRTLEDLARFLLNDVSVSGSCKECRHTLRAVADTIWPGQRWSWHRDTPGDVGTHVSTPSEGIRSSGADLAAAAGRRAAEAMRTLEEAAKLDSSSGAADLESLRYRLYELTAAVQRRLGAGVAMQWPVCLLLTESICTRPWQEVLEASLDAGVTCVQVREKALDDASLLRRVRLVVSLAGNVGGTVIVNDRVDIALTADAHGAHLGQGDLPVAQARRLSGRRIMLGVSTHSASEAAHALESGADYVGIGPVYTTTTKPTLIAAGLEVVRETLPIIGELPHLAIGGITHTRVDELCGAGVCGVAVGEAICGALDPHAAAADIVRAVQAKTSGAVASGA